MIIYTTFDIADQSFKFYTESQWLDYMRMIREELMVEDYIGDEEVVASMGWEELIECYHGEEMFYDSVDSNYVKN